MDSSIDFLYKHSAGTKTIDGFFPVYNLYGDIVCIKDKIKIQENQRRLELIDEGEPDVLLAVESDADESIEIIATVNAIDYVIYT
jgi:hypothetical protein